MKKASIGKIARIALYIALPVIAFVLTMYIVSFFQNGSIPKADSTKDQTKNGTAWQTAQEYSSEDKHLPENETKPENNSSTPTKPEKTQDKDNSDIEEESLPEEEESEESEEPEEISETSESSDDPEEENTESPTDGLTLYLVRVNMSTNVITVFTYDENGEYTIPVKAMICSTGDNTPQGSFVMSYQARWNGLILDQWGQYVSHITGDYLFHTVPSATQSASTVIVSDYNLLGTTASHGCIRITAGDAYWMYINCTAYETLIEIGYFDNDPLGKPSAIKLPTDTETNWDPTDPDPENPWNSCTPHFEGVPETITLTQGTELPDLHQGITAFDTCGNNMGYFTVEHDVDINTPGTYTVTFSCTDVLGRSATATSVVNVTAPADTSEDSVPEESTPEDGSTEESSSEASE